MYFFGSIGLLLSGIGILINSYLSILWFQGISIGSRPSFFLGILLIVLTLFMPGGIATAINKAKGRFVSIKAANSDKNSESVAQNS